MFSLCEEPKPNISTISGFFDPWDPLFMDYTNLRKKQKCYTINGNIFQILFLHIWTSMLCQFWKRWAPNNDEDPSNRISKIMDMASISIKKHERIFADMVSISTTKHIFVKGNFEVVINSGLFSWVRSSRLFTRCS